MLIVSIAVFLITEAAPGNVARNVLGIHITPEQEASFLNQQGLDEPFYVRYVNWLIGTDWQAERKVNLPVELITRENGFREWWAVAENGKYVRWEMEGEDLVAEYLLPDGSLEDITENERWRVKSPESEIERLTEYRTDLVANSQIQDGDRKKILAELDQILDILERETDPDQLLISLEGPEGNLEKMIDQEDLRKEITLEEMVNELKRKNNYIRAIISYQELNADSAEPLESADFQTYSRLFTNIGEDLMGIDQTLSANFTRAAESFAAEDLDAALALLDISIPRLDRATVYLTEFLLSIEKGNYINAQTVLDEAGDPQSNPLVDLLPAVLAEMLEEIGGELEDDVPELGSPLLAASESFKEGGIDQGYQQIQSAADNFQRLKRSITRSNGARSARAARSFWGINNQNLAVQWEKGTGKVVWRLVMGSGWMATTGGPVEYIPLQKGLLRGDPGLSLRTGRPVSDLLFTRLRNSLVLAGIAFAVVMPVALVLGLIAGLNEGKAIDRILSIGGMMFSVTPEFATGIFLILIFAFWLKIVPGATVFGEQAPWERPEMLVLPVLTLTLIELGYVLRITRASMSDVMKAPYIRTAFLKGLPYRRVVFRHAIRNALMSPITVIMLHVNWLLGGIVVVEVIFGYPGLGSYLLDSALFKDFNAIEGGAMILVAVAVGTQLIADIIYTFLNPRIRYD
jgi:peptide/nickel transport system permease protein